MHGFRAKEVAPPCGSGVPDQLQVIGENGHDSTGGAR